MKIEYRVRPVTRYVVTRFETSGPTESGGDTAGSSTRGQFDNERVAFEVAYALCKAEHDALGWGPGDERISYPTRADSAGATAGANATAAGLPPAGWIGNYPLDPHTAG